MHFICLKARAKCLFRGLLGKILRYMVGCGEKRSPGELVDFQGSPPPSLRMVHLALQEIEQMWKETCMVKQGAADISIINKKFMRSVSMVR